MSSADNGLRNRQDSTSAAVIPLNTNRISRSLSWKHAIEGIHVMSRSVNEANSSSHTPELSRSLYIDGVAYILRGLPTNLTHEERIRLGIGVPPQHESPSSSCAPSPQTISSNSSVVSAETALDAAVPSSLRTIVAKITVLAIFLLRFVLRCLAVVVGMLYRYDRAYRVSDRAILRSAVLLDRL